MTDGANEFESDEPASSGLPIPKHKPTPREHAQKTLGWMVVGAAMLAYLAILWVYLTGNSDIATRLSDITKYAIAGLQTLAAAVIGFYFGSTEDRNS